MKNLYLGFIILLFACSSVKPKHNLTITYDYNTKQLDTPVDGYKMKYGGTPTIIIKNINASQFNVEVDEQQINIQYQAETSSGTTDPERDPAGGSDIIPEAEGLISIDSIALYKRANELINKIKALNSTNLYFLNNRYTSLAQSKTLPFDLIASEKIMLDSTFLPLKKALVENFNGIKTEYVKVVAQLLAISQEHARASRLEITLTDAYDELKESDLINRVLEIEELRNLITESNYIVTYNAPAAKADEIVYTITIEPKDQTIPGVTQTVVPISVRIAGNWKIDVSSGAMFNLGLIDESYHFNAVEGDSMQLAKNKTRSFFSPTIGILTHFYRKNTNYINWGGSFGLSINDEQRLRYYAGAGIMLGENQRVVISAGVSAAPKAVLSGQYNEGQKFASASVPETVTTNVYRLGGFISLTYNLSSNRE